MILIKFKFLPQYILLPSIRIHLKNVNIAENQFRINTISPLSPFKHKICYEHRPHSYHDDTLNSTQKEIEVFSLCETQNL